MEITKDFLSWEGCKNTNLFIVFTHLAIMAEDYKASFSLRRLAEQTGLSHMTVKRVLARLESEGIITISVTQSDTVVTIWKYATCTKKRKTSVTQSVTAKVQQNKDLDSFVAPEHLDKWKEWLKYKSGRRDLYSTTSGAQKAYNLLLKICTITITDYKGTEIKTIDNNKLNATIDYCIAQNYKGIFEPKNYEYTPNNTGRTGQQQAERIAAQHEVIAAQSSFNADQRRAELTASLGLLGQAR